MCLKPGPGRRWRPVAVRRARCRGASLVEVLVAIVLASVGLMALAAAQAAALRAAKMTQYRGTAALLASDLGERLRANRGSSQPGDGFLGGAYDYTADFAAQGTRAALPLTRCDSAASHCTPAELAALDLAQWRLRVRDQLPRGSVFLLRQPGESAMDLWVAWQDPALPADESPAPTQECPSGLNRGADLRIRCSYLRVHP
ncbi:MAG: type IV pilus modification protein PilV [Rhodoferax sp.]|nr:type IV pilus modification protein PilV [Rhodoferax sp.]